MQGVLHLGDDPGGGEVALEQHAESISRQPCDERLLLGKGGPELGGDALQDPIADRGSEAVVDDAEAVEVEIDQGQLTVCPVSDGLFQVGVEAGVVGQPGQRIGDVLLAQGFLQQVQLVDVLDHDDGVGLAGRVGGQIGEGELHPECALDGVLERQLHVLLPAAGLAEVPEACLDHLRVEVAGGKVGQRLAADRLRRTAEDRAERGVRLHDDAVGVGEGDPDRGRGVESGEALARGLMRLAGVIADVLGDAGNQPLELVLRQRDAALGQGVGPTTRQIRHVLRGARVIHSVNSSTHFSTQSS